VLTEVKYFQGSLDYLAAIRATAGLENMPLMRKDFIFDSYQVYEARAYGADAILLIAAILEDGQLEELLSLARALGMQVLVEVHDEKELAGVLHTSAGIIGINNRDITTLERDEGDVHVTEELAPLVPEGVVVLSESAILSADDARRAFEAGAHGVLVGTAVLQAADPAGCVRELAGHRGR